MTWKGEPVPLPVSEMDTECVALCAAMNRYDGVMTIESCWAGHNDGRPHGSSTFYVSFFAESLNRDLGILLYCFDVCHSGIRNWRVVARVDCCAWPIRFLVEGPAGDFAGAQRITEVLNEQFEKADRSEWTEESVFGIAS